MSRRAGALLAISLAMPEVAQAGTFTTIPLGSYTANIQANLIAAGPAGRVVTPDPEATPFEIPPSGNNFDEVARNAARTFSVTVGMPDVTDVFTLMNCYAPRLGAVVGVITFQFSNGTSRSVNLVGGDNVRDFYHGIYANTLRSPAAENAFTYTGSAGGARTGDVRSGPRGTYVVDEQHFPLDGQGIGVTLTRITVTTPSGNRIAGGGGLGTPIILGLTVETPSYVSSRTPKRTAQATRDG